MLINRFPPPLTSNLWLMRSSSSIEEASCFCRLSWTISSDDSSSSARWVLHMRRTQRDHGTEHLDLHLKLLHVLGCSQSDILVYMLLFAHLHRYWKPPSYLPFDFVLLFLLSLYFSALEFTTCQTLTLWVGGRPDRLSQSVSIWHDRSSGATLRTKKLDATWAEFTSTTTFVGV